MAYTGVWRSASLPNMLQILEMALSLGSAAQCGPGTPAGSCPWLLNFASCWPVWTVGATRAPPPPQLAFPWGDFETLLHRCQRASEAGSMSVLLHACPLLPWEIKKKKKRRRRFLQ